MPIWTTELTALHSVVRGRTTTPGPVFLFSFQFDPIVVFLWSPLEWNNSNSHHKRVEYQIWRMGMLFYLVLFRCSSVYIQLGSPDQFFLAFGIRVNFICILIDYWEIDFIMHQLKVHLELKKNFIKIGTARIDRTLRGFQRVSEYICPRPWRSCQFLGVIDFLRIRVSRK